MTSPTALREAMARFIVDKRRRARGLEPISDDGWNRAFQKAKDRWTGDDIWLALADMRDVLRAIDAAGWRFDPKEPTEEMIVAGRRALRGSVNDPTEAQEAAADVWRAMLAAAPRITD